MFHFHSDVDQNRLSGTIPTELGSYSNHTYLCLRDNRLTGTIPTELGKLTSLTYLRMFGNRLSGSIPSELAALTHLNTLVVCTNAGLCGDIPANVTIEDGGWCSSGATSGTNLGSACPSVSPSASPSSSPTTTIAPTGRYTEAPTSSPTEDVSVPPGTSEQPLKDNWFRKRAIARKKAFPQTHSWWRKQEAQKAENV